MCGALPIALNGTLGISFNRHFILKIFDPYDHCAACCVPLNRVPTAQGKQGKWKKNLCKGKHRDAGSVSKGKRYFDVCRKKTPPSPKIEDGKVCKVRFVYVIITNQVRKVAVGQGKTGKTQGI